MSRNVSLLQLRNDIAAQCDFSISATGRYPSSILNRLINQSIQRFRERISNEGITHFLVSASGTLAAGTTSPYAFQTLDLSALSPSLVRTYGVDITVAGVVRSLAHRSFMERNEFTSSPTMTNQPMAWAHFQTRSIAIMPGPDTSYPYTVWYLPVLADLAADGDTFDGVAGWEIYVLWDCVCQLIARDQYAAAYQQAILERDKAWEDIVRSATKVSAAGGAVVGRDTMGQAGLFGLRQRRVESGAGSSNLPPLNSITNAMLTTRSGPIVLGRLDPLLGAVGDVPVPSLTSYLAVFAGGSPGTVPTGSTSAKALMGDGSWAPVLPVPSATVAGRVPIAGSGALNYLAGSSNSDAFRWVGTGWAARSDHAFYASDFGAVGDGSADDTSALNAAIAAAISAGGGHVKLGAAHKITAALATITGANNVYLDGRGGNTQGTRLLLSGADNINWITFYNVQSCGISGVYIHRAQINSATSSGYAVTFDSCFGARARDIWLSQVENGIREMSCTDTTIEDCKVRDIFGTRGIFVGGSGSYGNQTLVKEVRTDMGYAGGYPAGGSSGMATDWIANETPVPLGAIRVVASILNWQCSTSGNAGATNSTLTALPSTDPNLARSTEVTNGTAKFKFIGRADHAWLNLDSYGGDLEVANCAFLNGGRGLYMSDNGSPGHSSSIVRVADLAVDHPLDDCVLLEAGNDVKVQGWFSSSLKGRGVNVGGGFGYDWEIHDSRSFGHALDGMLMANAGNGSIVDNRIGYNSQKASGASHGVLVAANARNFKINSNHSGDINGVGSGTSPQGYGVLVLGGGSAASYAIVGNWAKGNQVGQISHPSGPGSQVFANVTA